MSHSVKLTLQKHPLLRPAVRYTAGLPILEKKDEILQAITNNQVVIVAGETGSGKTTQLPIIGIEAGRGVTGKIGCTQPRRIAAVSIADRVCKELHCVLGNEVGYKIRFSDRDSPQTSITFMTDGILLAELERDYRLSMYDTLIIDEAHERSLNIDFILGYLRKLLPSRPDLKLVISSATIDTSLFSEAFDNAPVIEVSGRMYPVEVLYQSSDDDNKEELSYVEAAVRAAEDLLDLYPEGDLLIFMPAEMDIRETCKKLKGKKRPNVVVLPLFSRLSRQEQELIFNTMVQRKIVVATNIAETSITVPGIRFVIDTGLARVARYAPRLRTNRLPIEPVSKAAANQRTGRCGRVMDGVCIRLYSEKDFASREPFMQPEIKRSNLAGVILSMIAHNLGAIETFAFLEPPLPVSIAEGYTLLRELGAIDKHKRLTELGRKMSRLPLDPHISRMVIAAKKEKCLREVLIIAAALSITDPRERPFDNRDEADAMHARFTVPGSDYLSFVKLWDAYADEWSTLRTQNGMRRFCKKNYLSYTRMREWHDVHQQLFDAVIRLDGCVINTTPAQADSVHRALCTGLLSNVAQKNEQGNYHAGRGRELTIFPGSSLYKQKPDWIVCHEVVETSQLFAHTVMPIQPQWLEEIAPHLCKRNYAEPWFDETTGVVRSTERVSLFGLQIIEHIGISYAKIDPVKATEVFIREGLAAGKLQCGHPFYRHNTEIRLEIESLEAKLRTRTLFAGEDAAAEFYLKRLSTVGSLHDLNRIIKEKGGDAFLFMRKEDLLAAEIPEEESLFPDTISIGNKKLDLQYTFNPGGTDDGITMKIDEKDARIIPTSSLGYLVPALWPEKISFLLRALPRELRKKLIPIDKSARELAGMIQISTESFEHNLSQILKRRYGIIADPQLFLEARIPDYLSMIVEVHDASGNVVASGRGAVPLNEITGKASYHAAVNGKDFSAYERFGLTSWEIGDIPEQVAVDPFFGGVPLYGFPGLVANQTGVDFRFFSNVEAAEVSHRIGVKKLLEIAGASELAWIERDFRFTPQIKLLSTPFGGDALRNALLVSMRESLLSCPQELPRSAGEFEVLMKAVRDQSKKIGFEALTLVEKTLLLYNENTVKINKHPGNTATSLKRELLADLREYIDEIDGIDFTQFRQYPRYMKAFGYRIDRAFYEPEKYRKNRETLSYYRRKASSLTAAEVSYKVNASVKELRLMIEEFSISLFAQQEVKTIFPVSTKRLDKKIAELEMVAGTCPIGSSKKTIFYSGN